MRLKPILAASLLGAVALLVAGFLIGGIELNERESVFSSQAQTVLRGNTPLFFQVAGETWLQPIAVYLNAAVQAFGVGRTSGRIVSVIAGATNVALVVLIGSAATGTAFAGLTAGIVLLLTPGHLALAIEGTDAILPATFILLWLYGFLRFLKWDSSRALVGAAAALGVCVYAHPSGPLTSMFLWALTLVIAWRRNRLRLFTATLVFISMWIPALGWFYLHPTTYPDTFGRWFILAAHIRSPLDAVAAFMNANTLGTRASLYWGFWDPSDLFFSHDGVPSAMLVLEALLIGAALVGFRHLPRPAGTILIASALMVPVAGATFGVPHYFPYAAGVFPILAILAGLGVEQLVGMFTRRRTLEDDVAVAAVDGWDGDDIAPPG